MACNNPASHLYPVFFQHAIFISHLGEQHKFHTDLTGTCYITVGEMINIREVYHQYILTSLGRP